MEIISYGLSEEYPMPERLKKNSYFARVLLSSYSGQVSEMTAVNQYFFHYLETAEIAPEISAGLKGISLVEMRHLDLLGTCIRQLGVSPVFRFFRGSRPMYWNAGFISYGSSPQKMIQADIQGELDAIEHYNSAIRSIREPQLQRLLRRIIEDEKLHVEILQSFLLLL